MDSPPPPLLRAQTAIGPPMSGSAAGGPGGSTALGGSSAPAPPQSRTTRALSNSNNSPRTNTRSPVPFGLNSSSSNTSPAHSSNGGPAAATSTHLVQPHLSPDIVSGAKSAGGHRGKSSTTSSSESDDTEEPVAPSTQFKGFDEDDEDMEDEALDESDRERDEDADDDNSHSSSGDGDGGLSDDGDIFYNTENTRDDDKDPGVSNRNTNETNPKPFAWTTQDLALLYKVVVLNGKRPVGINKHFTMMSIRNRFVAESKKNIDSDDIWEHLNTLYNLKELDEQDFQENWAEYVKTPKEFSLPEDIQSMLLTHSTTLNNNGNNSESSNNSTPVGTPKPTKRSPEDDEDMDLTKPGAAKANSSGAVVAKKTKIA